MNGTNEHEGREEKLIPFTEIDDRARNIAVAWIENYEPMGFDIQQKHKLASDIMNYAASLREQLAQAETQSHDQVNIIEHLEKELASERALNNDLKQEITYLKVTGSLLVDNDGEADIANKLYQAQVELGKERALRKELVQSLENLFVFHQRVRFPYELSYEKAIMNSVESILQKSKSLDEKK